jgi:hypothetical protein
MNASRRSKLFAPLVLLLGSMSLAACDGEDRPNVEVIGGGGSGSVSVSASASGIGPTGPSPTRVPGSGYNVVSNVDAYFAMALDLRDIREVMAPAAQSQPVDWAAATAIYENGKNQVLSNGSIRSLASMPNDSVQAVFPNGAAVFGRTNFIDALIRDGLNGTGRGSGASNNTRRQIVDKGIQMLLYGKALQELDAARTRVTQNNLDNATGAPHAVDEAWAAMAGAPSADNTFPHGLLATASGREANFILEGRLRNPLESVFIATQQAAQRGDIASFDRAHAELKGYLNAIFYLGTLRYVKVLEGDATPADRETHLAEGWTFWQTIRPLVAEASPSAAQTVESAYSRSPNDAFPADVTAAVYQALNEPAVIQALAIPNSLVVRTPPQ